MKVRWHDENHLPVLANYNISNGYCHNYVRGHRKWTYRGLTTKMRFMHKIVVICPMFNIIQTKLEKSLYL